MNLRDRLSGVRLVEFAGNSTQGRYVARAITDTATVKTRLIASADPDPDPDRLESWARYSNGLRRDCHATCCTLPVEVRIDDLTRLEVVDALERDEPLKNIAKRLSKAGTVEHFNQKHGLLP